MYSIIQNVWVAIVTLASRSPPDTATPVQQKPHNDLQPEPVYRNSDIKSLWDLSWECDNDNDNNNNHSPNHSDNNNNKIKQRVWLNFQTHAKGFVCLYQTCVYIFIMWFYCSATMGAWNIYISFSDRHILCAILACYTCSLARSLALFLVWNQNDKIRDHLSTRHLFTRNYEPIFL